MKSSEARIGMAESYLRQQLEAWGVDEPIANAHEVVTHLLREGWRPIAHAVRTHVPEEKHAHPNTAAREAQVAREAIAEGKAFWAAKKEATQ